MLKLIVCTDANNGIGKDNKIPWNIKEEMQHFKQTTIGHTIVMGRKTFESISKPLVNRKNIILTSNPNLKIDGVEIETNYLNIIELSKKEDVYVIGGAQIYNLFIDYCDEIIISKLNDSYDCDTFFKPNLKLLTLIKKIEKQDFNIYYYQQNQKVLNGRKIANNIKQLLINNRNKLVDQYKKVPHLVIIQVGNDFGSSVYVKNKMKLANDIGIVVNQIHFDHITQDQLLKLIALLNKNDNVHGILIQKPLPKDFDIEIIDEAIDPNKDVDCFNQYNVGKLWTSPIIDDSMIYPCTPRGIIALLDAYKIDIASKDVVILGRSNIVSKPLAALFINRNATVQICHSKSNDIKSKCKKAQIIVSAIGKPKFINKEYISNNQIVIDVGINRDENNVICGDVDFDDVIDEVSYISPVPFGIGPMTLIMLFKNLLDCYKKQNH